MGGHEKSITKAQKLILLGGGIQCLPPTEKGLKGSANIRALSAMFTLKEVFYELVSVCDLLLVLINNISVLAHHT